MKVVWKTFRELLPWLPGNAQSYLWRYVVVSCLLAHPRHRRDHAARAQPRADDLGSVDQLPGGRRLGPDAYVWIVGAVAFLILAKSMLAIGQQWFATRKFASFELEIGRRLFDAYIKAPWTHRLGRNTAQLVRIADVGIANATSGFLLPIVQLARPRRELRHDPRDHPRRAAAHRVDHGRLPRRHHGAVVLGRLGQVGAGRSCLARLLAEGRRAHDRDGAGAEGDHAAQQGRRGR